MLIHSIVPYEQIFPQTDIPKTSVKNFAGGYLELVTIEGKEQISRVESTDPAVYLKSRYTPGMVYKEDND